MRKEHLDQANGQIRHDGEKLQTEKGQRQRQEGTEATKWSKRMQVFHFDLDGIENELLQSVSFGAFHSLALLI